MQTLKTLLLALTLVPFGAMAQEPSSWTAEALQAMYMEHLHELKFSSEVDEDGDVRFVHEARTYFISVDAKDPSCFRLVLANIWPIESEEERTKVMRAMDRCNALAKVTKAYLVRDNVWVAVETFLPKPEDHREVFQRSLAALAHGVGIFARAMRE
jgi:hypothetical protein